MRRDVCFSGIGDLFGAKPKSKHGKPTFLTGPRASWKLFGDFVGNL